MKNQLTIKEEYGGAESQTELFQSGSNEFNSIMNLEFKEPPDNERKQMQDQIDYLKGVNKDLKDELIHNMNRQDGRTLSFQTTDDLLSKLTKSYEDKLVQSKMQTKKLGH